VPVLIGLIKFRSMTSYHTWSVKVAVAVTIVAYLLLFSDIVSWPFRLAALLCLYAAFEEIMITLLMKNQHVDVRTLGQAIRYNRQES
jgi:CDP-diacylglycerol--glycerol-3-phosphate 3-phosphatidyltransferase